MFSCSPTKLSSNCVLRHRIQCELYFFCYLHLAVNHTFSLWPMPKNAMIDCAVHGIICKPAHAKEPRRTNQRPNYLQRSFSGKPLGGISSRGADVRKNCQELKNDNFHPTKNAKDWNKLEFVTTNYNFLFGTFIAWNFVKKNKCRLCYKVKLFCTPNDFALQNFAPYFRRIIVRFWLKRWATRRTSSWTKEQLSQ